MPPSKDAADEDSLKYPFTHEAGHVLVAMLVGVVCRGIGFHMTGGMFCTLYPGDFPATTRENCLINAGGVAAELLCFPEEQSEGGGRDRAQFGPHSALSFDEAVEEVCAMLRPCKSNLDEIVAALMRRARGVNFNYSKLPAERVAPDDALCRLLLTEKQLRAIIPRELLRLDAPSSGT